MSKNVLIVEDDMVIAMINSRMVEKLGHSVCDSVSNGCDAISSVKLKNPDIILMDINLEGDIDGIEAMIQIREVSESPVIFISANSDQKTFDRAKLISKSEFLIKPVDLIQLQAAIGRTEVLV